MEIIIGKTAGFCFGVSNAVNKTKEALKGKKELYCLGELVHNKEVTKELEKEGLVFVDDIKKAKNNVIIRAHGEPKKTYKLAIENKLNILDLTCPKVMKIHNIVEEYSNNDFYIMLIGQKDHPETIGTISYCGMNSDIIETQEDIENSVTNFNNSNKEKILIISQTTFSMEKFDSISKQIQQKIRKGVKIEIKNTICNATRLRQEETKEISKKVDIMIVVGGKHSSNTNKLYNIANNNCKNSLLIENEKEIDKDYIKRFNKIGIIAGASTPKKSIDIIVEMLKNI